MRTKRRGSSVRTKSPSSPTEKTNRVNWAELLEQAVSVPGVISSAYHAFWNFSFGNALWAWMQCRHRGLSHGPMHTFKGWQKLGRQVRKGEKAIWLVMPVLVRDKCSDPKSQVVEVDAVNQKPTRRIFVERPHWFVLSQPDGQLYIPAEVAEWSGARSLASLKIERIEFGHTNGNVQGYAANRSVAVSPVAQSPHKTLLHEIAHIVLGHTTDLSFALPTESDQALQEVEAECVAMICSNALGLGGAEHSRGYIQHWMKGSNEIPERSIQKMFHAADQILIAGREKNDDPASAHRPS